MHEIATKTILSPENGMNLCRGCTHGCIYCDSRSACYRIEHPFEDVAVKTNAPELLAERLSRRRRPCMIGTGSMSDPYIPEERSLALTRRCLEIIRRYGCGVALQTKSDLVLRDLELLTEINRRGKTVLQMTLTTFDEGLCRLLEPNVCTTARRLEVLRVFRESGIPTVVWLSPILPFINDTEDNLLGILQGCFDAGVKGILCFGMGLTLREGSREYFYRQLDRLFPGMKQQYIRTFGDRYHCASPHSQRLMGLFHEACERHGVLHDNEQIFRYLREFPEDASCEQLRLF